MQLLNLLFHSRAGQTYSPCPRLRTGLSKEPLAGRQELIITHLLHMLADAQEKEPRHTSPSPSSKLTSWKSLVVLPGEKLVRG